MGQAKKPWESKTLVVNGILGLVAALSLFFPPAASIGKFLSDNAAQVAMFWSLLNVVLRTVTKDRIALGD